MSNDVRMPLPFSKSVDTAQVWNPTLMINFCVFKENNEMKPRCCPPISIKWGGRTSIALV